MHDPHKRLAAGLAATLLVLAVSLVLTPPVAGQGTEAERETTVEDEAAEETTCPGQGGTYVEVSVILDWEAEILTVDPESVTVYLPMGPEQPGRVCWTITGLQEDQTLHLGTKPVSEDLFPDLERKAKYPKDFLMSGAPAAKGTWNYEVWVSQEGQEGKLLSLDPEVVIQPGG